MFLIEPGGGETKASENSKECVWDWHEKEEGGVWSGQQYSELIRFCYLKCFVLNGDVFTNPVLIYLKELPQEPTMHPGLGTY